MAGKPADRSAVEAGSGKENRMRGKERAWTAAMIAAIIFLAGLAMTMGRYRISIQEIFAVLFPGLMPDVEVSDTMRTVIFNVRIPRVILSLLAGAGMAVAGASFQALFSNPLATPDTLGVATGASFGAVLGILWGLPSMMVQGSALAMGILAVILVYTLSYSREQSVIMVVLAGMVISALFSALVTLVKYVADPQDMLPAVTFWLMGNLAGTRRESLLLGAPLILTGILVIWLLRWKLNAMTLPEDEAKALGIPVKQIRYAVIAAAAMITASVVSMCGLIQWVGLLIPHVARMIFGNDNRSVIPASLGLGAIFMVIIDTVARCATASEIPVSILTAVIGAPVFIILLRKTGGIKL